MSSLWRRTSAVAEWRSHYIVLEKRSENAHASSSYTIPWPKKAWLTASVKQVGERLWVWKVTEGDDKPVTLAEGGVKTEATAKRKALKLVHEICAINRRAYTTTPEIDKALVNGWSIHPNFVHPEPAVELP